MNAPRYPKTPEEAWRNGTRFYAPDKVCERGHLAMRRIEDHKCVRCARIEERAAERGL